MSRVGKKPIDIPQNVNVKIEEKRVVVEGPKGKLEWNLPANITPKLENNKLFLSRDNDSKQSKSLHGLSRALINNMVQGVTAGFKKELNIVGVGYKAQIQKDKLILNLGFSHPVEFNIPEGIKINLSSATRIVIEGIDKQLVGEVAAHIRSILPPEPYKGKGIRYAGEEIRKKLGKAIGK